MIDEFASRMIAEIARHTDRDILRTRGPWPRHPGESVTLGAMDYDYARDCVNACDNVPSPILYVAGLKEEIKSLREQLSRCKCEYVDDWSDDED